MRRWEFIAGLGSTAAWPMVARAQQPTISVIGCTAFGGGSRGRSLQASSKGVFEELIYCSSRIFLYRTYRCQRVANAL